MVPFQVKGLGRFLETVYNRQRLHSALAHRPPEEFEQMTPPVLRAGQAQPSERVQTPICAQ